jgi:general secretion pathway protein N
MARRRVPERPAPAAPVSSRRPWWLIAFGLAAVLAFAIATLPASVLGRQLPRLGLEAGSLSGSVWKGRAQALAWRTAPLGDVNWTLSPLSLLRGRIGGDLDLVRPDGRLRSSFSASLGGQLQLEGVTADLPVEALAALPIGLPRGWRGRVSGQFDEIVVQDGWPTTLRGTLEMDGLIAPPPRNTTIGSYHVVIPDPQAGATATDELNARVTDKEGPFSFEGRFTLGADRSFLLEGTLAPRGSTPPALVRSLELLGPADAAGRRPVSVSGTL